MPTNVPNFGLPLSGKSINWIVTICFPSDGLLAIVSSRADTAGGIHRKFDEHTGAQSEVIKSGLIDIL